MVYLDYFIYIILIVLFYILMNKILQNENLGKEGFKHIGQSFIAGKKKERKYDKDDNEAEQDSGWILTAKTTYQIAKDVAYILIKMPYQILSKGVNMIIQLIQNFNEMLKPMYAFIKQMGKIVQRIAKQFYQIFKKIFTQIFNILKDMPGFIKKYADVAINFINTMVTKTVDMFTKFFDLFQNILNNILEIPNQLFNILDKLSDVFFNAFHMLLEIPDKGLQMIIGFQGTFMSMMDRPLKVPFSDLFLG